jgi:hypothetical protein
VTERFSGLVHFRQTFPLALFSIVAMTSANKGLARQAIDAMQCGGQTSLYDGLWDSLSKVQSYGGEHPRIVYVLSDGMNNDSVHTEGEVIAAYKAAGVPIVAFAYGDAAPTGTLFTMAKETGGGFFQSATNAAQIGTAFLAAQAKFSNTTFTEAGALHVVAGGVGLRAVPVDSSLDSGRIAVSWPGNRGDLVLKLLLPNGTESGLAIGDCEGSTVCYAVLDKAFLERTGYGNYQLQIANVSGAAIEASVLVTGVPGSGIGYGISAGFIPKEVTYPEDLALRATVSKGAALAGLEVSAVVTVPGGERLNVVLRDDGKDADQIANDGTYSVSVPYKVDGVYTALITASNAAGTGTTTYLGQLITPTSDGRVSTPESVPIGENFVRLGSASASVSGVPSANPDDHANSPSGGTCTGIRDDNSQMPGRIDYSGDVDCFVVVPSALTRPLVVRVTGLRLGMSPVVSVYNASGTVLLGQTDIGSTESPASGATMSIPSSKLDPAGMVIFVRHADPAAVMGGYKVSAGPAIVSDNHPPTADAGPDQRVECTGHEGASVTLNGSGSSDSDGDKLSYAWTGPFGTATGVSVTAKIPLGESTATLSVDDGRHGLATDSVKVNVVDTTGPKISSAKPSRSVIWPPNRKMIPVEVVVSARDLCSAPTICKIVAVRSDDTEHCREKCAGKCPDHCFGHEDRDRDWKIVGPLTVELRAEHFGRPRAYTISIQCVDGAGNNSNREVKVTVPHQWPHFGQPRKDGDFGEDQF